MHFGLIGKPLSHSFSERWFTGKFEREGLVGHRYSLFPLERIEEMPALLKSHPQLKGLNVTIPYKREVMPFLNAIDPKAAAVGAVNTIAIRNGELVGYNTDVIGFRSTLEPLLKDERPRALVLGSGGASRAVAFVLKELGIKFRVVSRSRERGDLTWDLLDPTVVKACPLVINTTPLGMYPDVDTAPDLPYEVIGQRHTLIDLVYNPAKTLFLNKGESRGATIMNGLPMLEAQAEASWQIWQQQG
jgi:shikimate dehydrogenase